ncbi:putative hsp90 co-chaperone Cdc37-like [Apostichopus japonicus]|uniref:Putative hsp90 co-chaperone Cdc37-like n=1 Tax=Stichopus japonicus TaxID=307972 RepID=A0A2G8JCX2_STIJA|nr:putative hsp90 co-chaperone Cdc37-like [Apostichopus japonicus]
MSNLFVCFNHKASKKNDDDDSENANKLSIPVGHFKGIFRRLTFQGDVHYSNFGVVIKAVLTLDKLQEAKNHLEKLKQENASEAEIAAASAELKKLEDDQERWKQKEEELARKERLTPWNVDTLSKEGFQKTLINKYPEPESEPSNDEESMERQQFFVFVMFLFCTFIISVKCSQLQLQNIPFFIKEKFVEKHEDEIKKFGMYKRLDDSLQFMIDHTHLACEFTANYLVIWCIDLEEEGKSDLMHQVAHQTITMQFLLELAKNLKEDPRACIRPFFTKMKKAEEQYQAAFNDELEAFIGRVRERAVARKERAKQLAEEQAKQYFGLPISPPPPAPTSPHHTSLPTPDFNIFMISSICF